MPAEACPLCQGALPPRAENKAFPFCSERCRMADLSKWLDEDYRVPDQPAWATEDDF